MIRFEAITARYAGAPRAALDDVTLDVPRGKITAIVGPNGSGKSTLVRLLLARLAPTAGTITIDGAARASLRGDAFARAVAVVPQREELTFPLPVREYLALGRLPHLGTWTPLGDLDRAAIDAAVTRTEIAPFMDRETLELSGGEWQRVRVARALAQGADALVLDEPTTFLDIAHEMALFECFA
ncbi:MAG: ABC transporter ATP-binding protein, partial [Gemmatimonadaceae bacterium]|nr:ABC transporter ATP-binding protein [Gemmatimonadaceae bacterium]